MRRSLFTMLVCLSLGGATCAPPPGGDAGTLGPVCTGEGATPSTEAGLTGTEWQPFTSGQVLATWPRPQGGIGSRINVRAEGYAEDAAFVALTTNVFGPPGEACDAAANPCAEERATCREGFCRLHVANQINRTFPVECAEDGALLITELPIRFRNTFELAELDGLAVELDVSLEPGSGDITSGTTDLVLEVGEFVQPSWWEDA